ncbi:MAG: MBL fold metallo-hydrolase [Patescibacteria group bacterium]|nr:MBL fold metallo-hydrolase [Patescibacteria group bacterium]MDW8279617.1 MBL fold metallo-hydrolase [bacterium]
MIVNYFGQNCFRLQSGEKSILIDPINNRLKGDIILKTIIPTNLPLPLLNNEIVFAGEYDIQDIEIYGFQLEKESTEKFIKTVFKIIWEDIKFVFLGPLAEMPDGDFLDDIEEPDILFIPSSGKPFIKVEDAVKLIKTLEPKIIIPSFIDDGSKEFFKNLSQKPQQEEKFVFKKKDILNKNKEVVFLKSL